MSAAAERAALAAAGVDILAAHGGPGERRAAALLRRIEGRASHPIALADLLRVPAWLRLPRASQRRLARDAALAAVSPHVAQSIDGGMLGGLADAAGTEAVDWAVSVADRFDPPSLDLVDGAALEPLGFALLRQTLPPELRSLLDWAPGHAGPACAEALARRCVEAALARDAR